MVLVTITWIIFGLLSLIKILSSLNKGFKQNFCSLILNFLSFIISFMFARLLINSKIADLVGNKYMEMIILIIGDLSSLGELKKFIGSIIVGITSFYILYYITLVLSLILKHSFIYPKLNKYKKDSNEENNKGLNNLGVIITSLISVFLTFSILITPIGFLCDTVSTVFFKQEQKSPFISRTFLNKLTEVPNNVNEISTTDEIFYTLYTIKSVSSLKEEDGIENISEIKSVISSKTHFLPTIIADVASTCANNWRNEQDFLGYRPILPEGREGKLYRSFLEVVEKWNKQRVVQDINTTLDIYKQLFDYGIENIKEENGILNALSEKEFTEELFINLYKNDDFCELIPSFIEYGLGSVFDYAGLEFNEKDVSKINVSKLSEEDVKREARLVAEIITIVRDINSLNQKIQNGEITLDDLQKIEEEISELESSKILGDIVNEFKFQLEESLSNIKLY